MASVWKRLQRVNKRAAKFSYTASYHRIDLETSPKWKPNKLSVVWARRSRRQITSPREWEPSLKDPFKGCVIFTMPENHTVAVTLFKDSRTNELEDKDWTFVLEDVSSHGKRRRLASCSLNMRQFASLEPTQKPLHLTLEPTTHKIMSASIQLTLHSVLLREGQATDEDMQSLASLLSVNNNSDIAVLDDLDEDDYGMEDHSTRQVLDIRQQMESMTQSLTSSDVATPDSIQSLRLDTSRTSTHPHTPEHMPEGEENAPEQVENVPEQSEGKEARISTSKELKFENCYTDGLKEVVFKPNTVVKRNLKPLDLKSNLNMTVSLNNNENDNEDVDKTPTGDVDRLYPKMDKDKTPVQDLLEWCQSVTREYKSCRVTNLTTSFRSGLAFCAIIHRHRPDLIDFSGLQPDEAARNVRVALDASRKIGVCTVLDARDVCGQSKPDRLAIMTYLFQLRAHFTGNELQVEQLGNDEAESSYLVGRHDTDAGIPRDLFSREVSARRSQRGEQKPTNMYVESPPPLSPVASPPIKDILQHSRSILNKMLSPGVKPTPTTKWFSDPPASEPPPSRPERLMTRKELTDPFGSDEEDETIHNNTTQNNGTQNMSSQNTSQNMTQDKTSHSNGEPLTAYNESGNALTIIEDAFVDPLTSQLDSSESRTNPKTAEVKSPTTPELPKPTPQLLSRHDELKERARLLLEQAKREARDKERNRRQHSKEKEKQEKSEVNGVQNGDLSPKKPLTEDERQAVLRERARKLIADARAGVVSPSSPLSPCRGRGTIEIITKQSVMDEINAAGGVEQLDLLLSRDSARSSPSRKSSESSDRSEERTEETKSPSESKRSPLQSFSAMIDRLTPDKDAQDEPRETGSYIASELEALEREQASVDEKAASLEKQLRRVMDCKDNTEEEDRLMSQWFNLVNKKNALLRRQMQLNILEQEEDLSRRCELLARELRLSLGVDEWRKTPGQKRRERLLLQELLSAVNERDRLVQEMDEQERAIADDEEIEHNLSQVEIQRKNNCILQ